MIEVYRSGVTPQECDDLGHMNVRYYVACMVQGLAGFALETGLAHVFRLAAPHSTLALRDQHIRFFDEARAGDPLFMTAGVLDIADDSVLVYQELRHADGRVCATFRTWADHIDGITRVPFAWSSRSLARLEALRCDPSPDHGPRSIDLSAPSAPFASVDTVPGAAKTRVIGRGFVQRNDCDAFDYMRPELAIGNISKSTPNLFYRLCEDIGEAMAENGQPRRIGAAVVEYRLVYRQWPRVGDFFRVHVSATPLEGRAFGLRYWLADPETGKAWTTAQAVVLFMDLDLRKSVNPSDSALTKALETLPGDLVL